MLISLKQSTNISHRKVNLIWQSHFQIIQICFIFDSYSCVTSSQVTVSPNTSQPPIPLAIPWILSLLYSTYIFKNKCCIRYIKNVPLPKYKFRDPMIRYTFPSFCLTSASSTSTSFTDIPGPQQVKHRIPGTPCQWLLPVF